MEIIYDKHNNPVVFLGKSTYGETVKEQKQVEEKICDTFKYGTTEYISWGPDNNAPDNFENTIRKTGVLQTALNYKCRIAFGQGVVPVHVTGYDEAMNETFEIVKDPEIIKYLRSYNFRNYHTAAFRDLIKYGNCFPILQFNIEFSKIVAVNIVNARHCRLAKDKRKLITFGNFNDSIPTPENKEQKAYEYTVLDEIDPFGHLEWLKDNNKLNNNIAFPRIRNYFSNNDYYAFPDWKAAQESGWIEIAHKIPAFLKRAYSNAMHLMWHIQIPYAYWERKFPKEDFENKADRNKAIENYMDDIEDKLTSEKNANKALFTGFAINESGKAEEQWKIERLENEIKAEERLSTSAAANSEILFSLMVNPSVLGAGMPGGPYAGNAGSGSDIREGLLSSIILANIEKNQVLDPVELMFKFNGYEDIDIKYRNIILNTLDKGKSTSETLQ